MPAQGDEPDVYEVFAQFGVGKAVEHVGSVRAADAVLGWHAAKEAYTRRERCTALWVAPRSAMVMSTAQDAVALLAGDRNSWRLPSFPSARRRARAASAVPADVHGFSEEPA
jgi:phenylacetate-CoA oxygenase PaaH subunit